MRYLLLMLLVTFFVSCKKDVDDGFRNITPTATTFIGVWGLSGITYLHFDTATGKQWSEYDSTEIDTAITFRNDSTDYGFKFPQGDMYLNNNYLSKLLPAKGRWYFQDQLNNLFFSCSSGCSDTALNQKFWMITVNAFNKYGYFYNQNGMYTDQFYSMTIENTGPLGPDRSLVSTIIVLWHK